MRAILFYCSSSTITAPYQINQYLLQYLIQLSTAVTVVEIYPMMRADFSLYSFQEFRNQRWVYSNHSLSMRVRAWCDILRVCVCPLVVQCCAPRFPIRLFSRSVEAYRAHYSARRSAAARARSTNTVHSSPHLTGHFSQYIVCSSLFQYPNILLLLSTLFHSQVAFAIPSVVSSFHTLPRQSEQR